MRTAVWAREPEAGSTATAGSTARLTSVGGGSLAGMANATGATMYPAAAPTRVMVSSPSVSISSRAVTVRGASAERALAGMVTVTVCGAVKSPASDSSTPIVAGSSAGLRSALSPGAPTVTVTSVAVAGGVTRASKAAVTVAETAPAPSSAIAGATLNSIPMSLSEIVTATCSTVQEPPPETLPTRLTVSSPSPVVSSSNTCNVNVAEPLPSPAGITTRTDSAAR